MSDRSEQRDIAFALNGTDVKATVAGRESLADTLRDRLQSTGVHLGCEQGVCGSCTVFLDGGTVRSCTTLAVQADGADVWTVEGLSPAAGLSDLQQRLSSEHGLQCGFCTPGIVVSATELLATASGPLDDDQVRTAMSGNLCRCTGYDGIVRAIVAASQDRIELPTGLDVTAPEAGTGDLSALPEHRTSPAPTDPSPDRRVVATPGAVPELLAALGGFLVGAGLRRRRRG